MIAARLTATVANYTDASATIGMLTSKLGRAHGLLLARPLKSDWLRTTLILSCALSAYVALLVSATVACTVSCTAALADPTTDSHRNRLIHSASPYLLQHAHNPVDWYPWG